MPHFVYDDTALLFPKTNLNPLPAGGDPTQYVQSVDWNTLSQATEDIKTQLRGAQWYGVEKQAVDPAPAGITDYLWSNVGGDLFYHTGGVDISLSAGGGTVTGGANVGSGVGSVGVFKQLNGGNIELKGIRPASSKLTVLNAVGTDDVDIDVVEANLAHQSLGGAGTNDHAAIDARLPTVNEKAALGGTGVPSAGNKFVTDDDARLVAGTVSAHTLGGASHSADTLANLNLKISDATLDSSSATRVPSSHGLAGAEHASSTFAQLNAKISDATLIPATDSRLSDARVPTSHGLGGAEHAASTLAQLNAKVSDATLDDSSASRTPTAHGLGSASHSADTFANLNTKVSDQTLAALNVTQKFTKGQSVEQINLVLAANIAIDGAATNNFRIVSLSQNVILDNPTNVVRGQVLKFPIAQDGTGGRTVGYGAAYIFPAGTPTMDPTAGALALLTCYVVSEVAGVATTMICYIDQAGSGGATPTRTVGIAMSNGNLDGNANNGLTYYVTNFTSKSYWQSNTTGGERFVVFELPLIPGDILQSVTIWGGAGFVTNDELRAKLFTETGASGYTQISTTKISGTPGGNVSIGWTSLAYTVLSANRITVTVRLSQSGFIGGVQIQGMELTYDPA